MGSQDADRKKQIVRATFDALKENGLPALSYDRIAEYGGLTRQLVRYHYKNPDDLMIDLCDYLASLYRESLIAGVMKQQGAARLRLFLDFYFDLLSDMPKPKDDQVYDALMSMAAGNPKIRQNLRDQYSLLGQVLSHELELQYPELGEQGSKELSYLFISLMYGHWKMVASLGLARQHAEITRKAIDRLIESYVATPPDSAQKVRVWTRSAE